MGSSSSKSSQSTNTTNVDKRLVVNEGMGISSDSSTITVNNTSLDKGVIDAAMKAVSGANATAGEGFSKVLGLADGLFEENTAGFSKLVGLADRLFVSGADLISRTQDATLAQIDAVNSSANDERGAIDQKTIIVLAVTGAVVAAAIWGKK